MGDATNQLWSGLHLISSSLILGLRCSTRMSLSYRQTELRSYEANDQLQDGILEHREPQREGKKTADASGYLPHPLGLQRE